MSFIGGRMKSVMVVGALFALLTSNVLARSRFIPSSQFRAHIEKSGISLPPIPSPVCKVPEIKLKAHINSAGKVRIEEWENESSLLSWPKTVIDVAKRIARTITLPPFQIGGVNSRVQTVVEFPCTQTK